MITVMEDLDLPGSGTPPALIEITLWGAGRPVVGREVSTGKYIAGTKRIVPNNDGIWSAELVSNLDIIPEGTTYQIKHLLGCDNIESYISVPITGGPFTPQQIEVDAMNSVAAPALSIHASDLLLHGGGIELDYADIVSDIVVTGTGSTYAAIPGLVVTVPDVARPVYLYGQVSLTQQSGGPTAATVALVAGTLATPGIFASLDAETRNGLVTTVDQAAKAQLMVRLAPHSGGDYQMGARGNSSNFTVVVRASVLGRASIHAIAR